MQAGRGGICLSDKTAGFRVIFRRMAVKISEAEGAR